MSGISPKLKSAARAVLGRPIRALWRPPPGIAVSNWRLERDGVRGLMLDGLALDTLAERWSSPLHVVDAARLAANAAAFVEPPPGAGRGCEIFYSYKTNPVPGVLRILYEHGVGAEVTSEHDLWLARHVGVDPSHVILNGTAKSVAFMTEAVSWGVALINLNGREEIDELAAVARRLGKRARVGIRIVPSGGWASQFGETADRAVAVFADALARPEFEVVGVHAHRGPQVTGIDELEGFVDSVLDFCDTLRKRLSFEPQILDLGGGLCCPSSGPVTSWRRTLNRTFGCELPPRDPRAVIGIRQYVAVLAGRVEAHYRSLGCPVPRIFLEPGRAMTGNTQLLLTKVLRVKQSGGVRHAILDAGVNIAQPLQNEYHAIHVVNGGDHGRRGRYRLVGPVSSPGDMLCAAVELPELAPGDTLAIMDTGAYFVACSTSFSYHQPGIAIVENGAARLLRRAETSQDLVARDL